MQMMQRSQREVLANALQEMDDLLTMIKTDNFDFELSWRDEDKLWAIKKRAEEIMCRMVGMR